MRKLLIWFVIFLLAFSGFYVWRASQQKLANDTWELALLGPGRTPDQCVARMRPWFDEHEPTLTEIADRLIGDPEVNSIGFDFLSQEEGLPFRVSPGSDEENWDQSSIPSPEEIAFFGPRLDRVGGSFYSPSSYQYDGIDANHPAPQVTAYQISWCGNTLPEWVAARLRIYINNTDLGGTAMLLYFPEGIPENETRCSADILEPSGHRSCGMALTHKWLWRLQLWPEDFFTNPKYQQSETVPGEAL